MIKNRLIYLVFVFICATSLLISCSDKSTSSDSNEAPEIGTSPTPANGATEQPLDVDLSWSCTDPENDPLTFDVYFGNTSTPPLVSSDQTSLTYQASSLDSNTTYYWRVVASDDHDNTAQSPVWSFTTVAPPVYSYSAFAVGVGATIYGYDGTDWVDMNIQTTAQILSVNDVWGSSRDDVFAVCIDVAYHGVVLHYDGSTWEEMLLTNHATSCVWGTSGNDVYVGALTTANQANILHYDGTNWTDMVTFPDPNYATDIWGSSSTDIYTFGESSVLRHFDGSTWELISNAFIPGPGGHGIWGFNDSTIFMVGSIFTTMQVPAIYEYDGQTWVTGWNTGNEPGTFNGIWGSSPNNLFAVGEDNMGGPIIYRYQGSGWFQMSTTTDGALTDIWGSSTSNVIIVGENGTILHYNGLDLNEMVSGTTIDFNAVWVSN
jgi:hypothetical protein